MEQKIVTHFVSNKTNSEFSPGSNINHNKPGLSLGTLKYSTKKKITDAENVGTLIFTTDTGEFYTGTGYDSFIKKISDVFIGVKQDFPAIGVSDKLYCAVDEKTLYYWDKTRYCRFATLDTSLYQDVFEIGDEAVDTFQLKEIPLNNVLSMNINGITYFIPDFSYDEETNTVSWNQVNDFAIKNSKVVFQYEILKKDIDTDITDSNEEDNKEEVVYNTSYIPKKRNKLKINNNHNGFSITYKSQKGVI